MRAPCRSALLYRMMTIGRQSVSARLVVAQASTAAITRPTTRGCDGRLAIVEPRTVPSAPKKYACARAPPPREAPDRRPVEGAEADEELATLAKALGHPARVQIMRLLVRREACICGDIVDELPLAQSTVSQHLKVLKGAGLIRGEIDGPRICYCVEPRTLRRLKALVGGL